MAPHLHHSHLGSISSVIDNRSDNYKCGSSAWKDIGPTGVWAEISGCHVHQLGHGPHSSMRSKSWF